MKTFRHGEGGRTGGVFASCISGRMENEAHDNQLNETRTVYHILIDQNFNLHTTDNICMLRLVRGKEPGQDLKDSNTDLLLYVRTFLLLVSKS